MEMEAAFKQLMQQHSGNNEFVTLAMTSGKGLELVSDPSQVGAIMQAAAMEAQQCLKEDNQEVSQQDLVVGNEAGAQIEQFSVGSTEHAAPVTLSATVVEGAIAKLPSEGTENGKFLKDQ